MIYLACPYNHPNHNVMAERFQKVTRFAGHLILTGHVVYSPITHGHPIAQLCNLPKDWPYWESYDRKFIEKCDEVMVLMLPGWEESVGVTAEIRIAKEIGMPITYMKEWSSCTPE